MIDAALLLGRQPRIKSVASSERNNDCPDAEGLFANGSRWLIAEDVGSLGILSPAVCCGWLLPAWRSVS
jgi:hypothetical protein